jgi:hypothetical protein
MADPVMRRRRGRPPAAIAGTRALHPREAVRALADRDRDRIHGAEQGRVSHPVA